ADDELADEEDPFANLQRIEGVGTETRAGDGEPEGGPPPEGSFAAWAVAAIDTIKMGWIDVVLRQLVILVAFFGGMMATHRGKHINVDALSKMLGPGVRRLLGVVTNLLALGVCLVLARAGGQLVAISREHPRELVPWADEWVFQLMYPLGFSLLAFHFAVRVAEAIAGLPPPGEVEPPSLPSLPDSPSLRRGPQGTGGPD
ncbi:MAG: TRAP transporter small permease, partial [Deltaproteobacteria bacterium]|nr:TRAP transporter small permease [Nannocystaceae bacterium]